MRTLVCTAALALSTAAWAAPAVAVTHALHSDQFRVFYEKPKDPAHQALYEELKSKRVLEKLREFLSFIRLPRILTLKLAGCNGDDNAWYEPEDLTVTVCYEYLEEVRKRAPTAATPAGVTPENAFLGPLIEVFLHEIGHALFDQLQVPILGHEEDAADQFAAYFLVHLSPPVARDAMGGVAWMYAQEAKDAKISQSSLANVHGLAGQRYYNTLCLAYGAEPDVFKDLIDRKLLPQERAEDCEDEYRQVAFAIQTLMSRYIDVTARDKVLAERLGRGQVAQENIPGERLEVNLNLDARYYVDPALFERERHAIFRRHWQLLGPTSQLREPRGYLAVDTAGWKLFALRGRDGVLRGFHNVCRHRGARLLEEGTGKCQTLRCPYHNWVYAEDGALLQAPYFGEDASFDPRDWPLQPAQIAEWRGLLFIAIDPEQSLLDQLGDLPEEVEPFPLESYVAVDEKSFVIRSNWKTYTDNFVEGYHIPGIHPGFMKVIDFKNFETVARNGLVRMTSPQRGGSIYGGKWLWMWPNWTLSVFPGGMNTSRINPLGVDSTQLHYHFYFSDLSAGAEASRRETIEVNCGIVREDFGICESTQLNYASGAYSPGPLSPRHEQSVAYFQGKVTAALR